MTRRGFIGVLLGAAVAPKTMLARARPAAYFGGRYEAIPQTMFRPERIVIKLHTNSLYGKLAA
jgi:hypothetical protein